ncbi:MAG TPA: phosphoglucosamine mutase [Gammaproteobacteria bacterium]|nr:phosphoglucosamine mutase [Xanthomonadales bacterium]HOP21368.1 phosphoglucosamine mutase [Gammaproteobacteria bacterium]HPI94772.1 phosphoglucosamine mutase [Gammaproteobacteria bacterium]HPQ86365.1 phosphoglucosamine mutase [Gammaproteobacteria bacterium]
MSEKKYFGTDGIRGKVGGSLMTAEFALKLGRAAGVVLGRLSPSNTILIGKDTRISGYMLESALEAGLSSAGTNSLLLGPMPTPGIAWMTSSMHASAGIVISASHNPYYDNGIKFFNADGEKLSDELELAIENEIDKDFATVSSEKLGKAKRVDDAAGRYIEFCKSSFPRQKSLAGLKIVLDCANGATYHIAPQVFSELGADVTVIANKPDGLNINADCGSTHPQILQEQVLETGADLGIALDGDGDRVLMIDHYGQVIDGDQLIFIVAKHLHKNGKLNGGVVGTLMSNQAMQSGLSDLGIDFLRADVGDRYVHQLLRKNNWYLGGESSGHILNLDLATTGDGIVSALMVLSVMIKEGKNLKELADEIPLYPQVLINITVENAKTLAQHKDVVSLSTEIDKVLGNDGRTLIRASGTQPMLRVMVEAKDENLAEKYASELVSLVNSLWKN